MPSRRFELAADEVLKLNPNTGTLPMFRTRIDADITLGIYRRHPVLIRDDDPDGNPWGLSFGTLFHMANDSGLFHQPEDFSDDEFNGWSYERDGKEYVPLYEAKMLSHFDHRFSTYRGATQAQLNVGTLPRLTDDDHDDPNLEPLARYWVDRVGGRCQARRPVGPRLASRLARHHQGRADAHLRPVSSSRLQRSGDSVFLGVPGERSSRHHCFMPSGPAWPSITSRDRS